MYHGKIVAILDRSEATPERLGLYMGGAIADGDAYVATPGGVPPGGGGPPPPVGDQPGPAIGGTAG
jgi:hypothetical protein